MVTSATQTQAAEGQAVQAFLLAARALVGVAARSLVVLEGRVSIPQFRLLVVLAEHGTLQSAVAAAKLGVNPSSVTRLADRLVAAKLIRREPSPTSRSVVCLTLTPSGKRLVAKVMKRRLEEVSRILANIPGAELPQVIRAMEIFSAAAGERPGDRDPLLGVAP